MLKTRIVLTNANEKFFRDFFRIGKASSRWLRFGSRKLRLEKLDIRRRSMDLLITEDDLPDVRRLCRKITVMYRILRIDLVILQDEGKRYLTGHLMRYCRGSESAVNICVTSRTSSLLDAYIALRQ